MSTRSRCRGLEMVAAVLLAAAFALAGCGDGSGSARPSQGGPQLDQGIDLADCTDWKQGSVEERLGTIRQIRQFAGGAVAGTREGTGPVIDDEKAYDLFENYCRQEYARGFKLYKLYVRAAAFDPLTE
ncbi:MAG: hypothetical protein ABR536_03545 [Solirubrobacterales bacterium]